MGMMKQIAAETVDIVDLKKLDEEIKKYQQL